MPARRSAAMPRAASARLIERPPRGAAVGKARAALDDDGFEPAAREQDCEQAARGAAADDGDALARLLRSCVERASQGLHRAVDVAIAVVERHRRHAQHVRLAPVGDDARGAQPRDERRGIGAAAARTAPRRDSRAARDPSASARARGRRARARAATRGNASGRATCGADAFMPASSNSVERRRERRQRQDRRVAESASLPRPRAA